MLHVYLCRETHARDIVYTLLWHSLLVLVNDTHKGTYIISEGNEKYVTIQLLIKEAQGHWQEMFSLRFV